ncbi:MAG: C39 family peptidase [Roseburia sp.]|nr:C39 family peptidase [Roseburia sp.]
MKKHKGILIVLAVTIVAFLMVLTVYMQSEEASGAGKNVVVDTEALSTETIESTENQFGEEIVETETEEVELSYIELYGLEEVDKPEKRTEEQVLQKLAELSEEHELVRQIYEEVDLYSMEMLDHLANNPEMAAYVIGSLEADGSVTGGFTEAELEEEFPLLLQFDPRWGYFEYGGKEMGLSGCGPTCLAMTILALTDFSNVTPDKIAAYSLEKEYYVKDVGTAWKLLDEFPTLYGLSVEHPTLKEESMKAALDEGKVLICSVKKGVFTAEGHFIIVYGYDETGFMVNDPKCVARSNRTWTFDEFGKQLKRIWAVGAENAQETAENSL